jgi:ABC-type glutathione transport system ATPase component
MTAATHAAPVIGATGISKSFGAITRHVAVKPLDLALAAGSMTGIVGESGSGKSTLARMLAGLSAPTTGSVSYVGQDLYSALRTDAGKLEMRRTVQFVGQDTTSSFDPRHTLRESIAYPAMKLLGLNRAEATGRTDELLDRLQLPPGLADRFAHQVSGGQRQRFALARGLIVAPRMLICDEVVSALDVSVQAVVLNHLKEICADQGSALLFVSHGLPATAFVSESIIVMLDGAIVEHAPVASILHDPQHPYTRKLLDAYRGTTQHQEASA